MRVTKWLVTGALFCAVGAPVVAQTLMPLPPFDRTFSSPTLTRGYYFQAPADFAIVGLRVPDETMFGLQNVEVVRFNTGAPPAFPSTTNNFVSLTRHIGVPSANIIPVNIPVLNGEWIGILGAAGDASIMHNSYGPAGPFNTTIFGQPTTLTRMGMQFNMVANPAMDLWSEAAGPVSRVEMYYDAIPGPGALAMLGLGGLFVRRRRQ